ncbi:MAG: IS1595 family transposase [Chloroflexi bacterium]|nr:IS1595 family transposase [Chloroflexota bacterium]
MKQMDLMQLMERFHSDEKCREVLEELRWPNGIGCPRCGGSRHAHDTVRGVYDCYACGYQFSVLAGTIFHDTKLPLRKWFITVMLMVESKKGMSANQLKRVIGVSYKTAWYLCHRIRAAMREAYPIPLKGIVEIDETFIGGEVRGKGRGYKGNKAIVVGAVERDGKIILKVVPDRSRKTLHAFANEAVADDAEAIHTDDWRPYQGIGDEDTLHETVNHSIGEYARGNVNTNSVENVWSLLKRSIIGSYHKVSIKHLEAYLDELEWRFNNRDNPWLFRDTLVQLLRSESLPYETLTKEQVAQ